MAKNYFSIAAGILESVGGVSNVSSVSHCMTRLRVRPNDMNKVDVTKGRAVAGVLNVVVQNGEVQYVVGQDVPSVHNEFVKLGAFSTGGAVEDTAALKEDMQSISASGGKKKGFHPIAAVLDFIGGTFSPVIPVLVAGGLTGAVLTMLTNFFGFSTESGTYQVFYAVNQAAFFFLPIFIGFSAATQLKSNAYLGAFLGAVLLFSGINGVEGLDFFGFPITPVTYNSTVFPVILGVLFMSILYWILQKITPVFLRTIFVPLITMLVTVPVTLLYLGPVGGWAGDALANAVYGVYQQYPPVAVMLIGCLTPWMVFFGMNNATYPVVFALMKDVGSDPLICTGMAPANVAVGGACLAVALKSRDVNLKGVGLSAGATALCGITEPGVYGVLFPKRTPLVGAMLGGGLGGLLAGYLGMTQYVISTPGFISFPAYINPDGSKENFLYAMGVMALAAILSFIFTWLLYREKQPEGQDPAA